MTSAQLVDLKGKKVGEVTLDDSVFAVELKQGAMFEALIRQLANARTGSANTKTRSEVSGGGRKPWRQKGTGRARAGSIRSPLWAGGGVIFGPKPRDYSYAMPRKMRQLAVKSALSARKEDIVIVKDFDDIKEGKTKLFAACLKDLGLTEKKVLLVLDFACDHCKTVERAARNIAGLKVIHASNLNVKDILEFDTILTSERTIEAVGKRFSAEGKAEAKAAGKKAKAVASAEPGEKKAPAKAKESKPRKEASGAESGKAAAPKKKAEAKDGDAKPARKKKAEE